MVPQVKVFAAQPDNLSSVPENHNAETLEQNKEKKPLKNGNQNKTQAGEVQLKESIAVAEVLSSVPITHMLLEHHYTQCTIAWAPTPGDLFPSVGLCGYCTHVHKPPHIQA